MTNILTKEKPNALLHSSMYIEDLLDHVRFNLKILASLRKPALSEIDNHNLTIDPDKPYLQLVVKDQNIITLFAEGLTFGELKLYQHLLCKTFRTLLVHPILYGLEIANSMNDIVLHIKYKKAAISHKAIMPLYSVQDLIPILTLLFSNTETNLLRTTRSTVDKATFDEIKLLIDLAQCIQILFTTKISSEYAGFDLYVSKSI